jgi:DNA polymerase-3 subunit beta
VKLSCLQGDLNKGLGIVGRAVVTHTTLPITNNILLSTDESRLKLAATNLDMAITHSIEAQVEEEGSITVPARLLIEFTNSLPPGEKVDMKLVGKTLELRCLRYEARISGIDATDFPLIPKVDDGIKTKVDTGTLRQNISQVVFAAATDESRPVLSGIDAQFEGNLGTLAASDGFRLAVYKMPLATEVKEKVEVIIPAKTMHELNRLITDDEETVEIIVNPNRSQIMFHLKKTQLVSQLNQGTFPKFSQLIPQSFTECATVSVAEFLRACKIASIFTREGTGIVRLIITPSGELIPGKITVSSKSEELGDDIGEIDAIIEGQGAKIAFNGKYLTDVLSVLKEQKVTLQTTNSSSPGVIKPVGTDNYLYVIMPMFVQW